MYRRSSINDDRGNAAGEVQRPSASNADDTRSLQSFRSGCTSLSMFQLTYPTIITDQMKALRRRGTRTAIKEDNVSNADSSNADRACFYENSTGQSMPMTLVETISFSTSDFTDNFLTCPTCLCSFDEASRLPRLLPCSHTICRECLERILCSSNNNGFVGETGATETIRCPVCREAILMPRGGLNQLPPSYLINRLMDMIKRKKSRDYIPKCTVHSNESLLFCETCDSVFCPACEQNNCPLTPGSSHHAKGCHGAVSSSEHMVVPFSVAIKRVSEIVNYKSNQCTQLLDNAVMAIRQEMERLDVSVQLASDAVVKSFDEIFTQIERRKFQLMDSLCKLKEQKMMSLAEQLEIVQAERTRLECNNAKLLRNPDIRKLTDQIQSLNSQVESGHLLAEPRENSFLKFEFRHNQSLTDLSNAINQFGRIRVSNTYPPLCTAQVDGSVANVCCSVSVTAMDYNGNVQNVGGDPLSVNVTDPSGKPIEYNLKDSLTGSYNISFLPDRPGRYRIDVKIFNRPIRGSPLSVNISEHNNPIWSKGPSDTIQTPVGLVIDDRKLYVLDTGTKEIIILEAQNGEFLGHLCGDPWITSTTTGICLICNGVICTADWKQKKLLIIRYNSETNELISVGELIHDCQSLAEPISVAFRACSNSSFTFSKTQTSEKLGTLVVLDGDASKLFIIDLIVRNSEIEGVQRNTVVFSGPVRAMSLSTTGNELHFAGFDQYLHVCDLSNGTYRRKLKGCYTAICVDHTGRLIAARCDGRHNPACTIEVYSCEKKLEKPTHKIDSFSDHMRRPYSLVTDREGHIFCADFTGHSIKKYRYV